MQSIWTISRPLRHLLSPLHSALHKHSKRVSFSPAFPSPSLPLQIPTQRRQQQLSPSPSTTSLVRSVSTPAPDTNKQRNSKLYAGLGSTHRPSSSPFFCSQTYSSAPPPTRHQTRSDPQAVSTARRVWPQQYQPIRIYSQKAADQRKGRRYSWVRAMPRQSR
jgi:hypothetical protein